MLLWARNGWIDYLAPQLYWKLDHNLASTEHLAKWWNDHTYGVDLYIGYDTRQTMTTQDYKTKAPNELDSKVKLSRSLENVKGNVWWHGYWVTENFKGVFDKLKGTHQSTLALVPAYGDKSVMPEPASDLRITSKGSDIALEWKAPKEGKKQKDTDVVKYVVYEFLPEEDSSNLDNASAIISITPYTRLVLGLKEAEDELKGNTYVVEGQSFSGLYRLGGDGCVLLDTPMMQEYSELKDLLTREGLRPEAVMLSHVHHDHSGCAGFLRRDFGAKIYASVGEAAAMSSPAALCDYIGFISPGLLSHSFLEGCVLEVDGLIGRDRRQLALNGAEFQIIPSRGHTPDHICTLTPDGVLFCGDALVSLDEVARQKMTYSLCVADQIASARRLAALEPELAVVSHRAVVDGGAFEQLCQVNIDHLEACVLSLLEVIQGRPMGIDEICEAYCLGLNMTHVDLDHPQKALMVRRVALSYVQYLIDTGRLRPCILGGVFRYARPAKEAQR